MTAISSMMGQDPAVINVFTELWLYLENNKDQLDVVNTKNVQLEAELNQTHLVGSKLPSSQRFLQTLKHTTVLGVRNLKSGGHAFVCGKMRTPLLLQG